MKYFYTKATPSILEKGFLIADKYIPIETTDYTYYSYQKNTSDTMPDSGLVFHWKGESYSAETGQTMSGNAGFASSYGISCACFNGENNEAITCSDSLFPMGDSARTLCFWMMKPSDLSWNWILHYGNIATGETFGIILKNDKLYATIMNKNYETDKYIENGRWYFITLTLSGTFMKLYVDGVLFGTHVFAITPATSSYLLYIGGKPNSISTQFSTFLGFISTIRIYNRILSSAEVALLATEWEVDSPFGLLCTSSSGQNLFIPLKQEASNPYNGMTGLLINTTNQQKIFIQGAFNIKSGTA